MSQATASEIALVRSICRESFFAFVQEFWQVVVPEAPVWNWHIKYLCDEFQADAERVFRNEPRLHDTIVNISPGSTKSTILSIMAPAWIHARRPDMRILCGSHTQALTFELGRKCRMVEESKMYQDCFPEMKPSFDQWAKSLFMNTSQGGRMACTVGGMSPTGFHAHFIIIDDPLDPQQAGAKNEVELNSANNFMTEVLPTRKVNKEVSVTWLIMQRLHQNDPTGYLLNRDEGSHIRHICLPAERTTKVRPRALRKYYTVPPDSPPGTVPLMDPVRLSGRVLQEAKIALGTYAYAGQYLQDPVPRGGGMFKPNFITVHEPPPFTAPGWIAIARGWDKAGTSGGGAYTVGFLMGRYRHGHQPQKAWKTPAYMDTQPNTSALGADGSADEWWILDVIRQQLDSGARERLIVQTAQLDGRRVTIGVEQEPGSGGKESAQATVARLAGYKTRVILASGAGSKEDRADIWSSLMNQGLFHMKPGIWNQTLLDELRYFPLSKYKDQVDGGSVAFATINQNVKRAGALV